MTRVTDCRFHAGLALGPPLPAFLFHELDASIRGWIDHVGHADSWGLRRHALGTLPIRPAEHWRARAAGPDAALTGHERVDRGL